MFQNCGEKLPISGSIIQCSQLSLVEVQRGSALIGREFQGVDIFHGELLHKLAIKNQLKHLKT